MKATQRLSTFKGIIDTTLRDGQQSPLMFDSKKYSFSLDEKKKIFAGLLRLGIRHFEFFSPVVSDREKSDFISLKKIIPDITDEKVNLYAHCRCIESDITQSIEAGFDGVNMYLNGTKNAHSSSYRNSRKDMIKEALEIIKKARNAHPKLYMRFSVEDAFRTPLTHTLAFFDVVAPYVDTLGIPDTVGIAQPQDVRELVIEITKRYPHHDLECHFHNDRGYALANSMEAICSGAAFTDASVWGLAERSGIASVTGLLLNLYATDPSVTDRYDVSLCYPLNVLMGSILGLQVPYTEPVSITNRTHIAGVHQKAVIRHKSIYEAHSLEAFGVTKRQLLLGPLSGWNAIYYYVREFKNIDISVDQAKVITLEFREHVAKKSNGQIKVGKILNEIVAKHGFEQVEDSATSSMLRYEHFS